LSVRTLALAPCAFSSRLLLDRIASHPPPAAPSPLPPAYAPGGPRARTDGLFGSGPLGLLTRPCRRLIWVIILGLLAPALDHHDRQRRPGHLGRGDAYVGRHQPVDDHRLSAGDGDGHAGERPPPTTTRRWNSSRGSSRVKANASSLAIPPAHQPRRKALRDDPRPGQRPHRPAQRRPAGHPHRLTWRRPAVRRPGHPRRPPA